MALGLADQLPTVRGAFVTFLAGSRHIRMDGIDRAFASAAVQKRSPE
jgi:hypothetical protein